jgi:exodeoxyribonuclease VII large subunit
MSETPQAISLLELNNQVKSGIRDLFPGSYWIVGEISEMNVNQSGHCYVELIEKKDDSDQITARAKGNIWAYTFRMLRPYFESVTGQRFSTGIKIMVKVSIEFHEVYGYSLNIKDIEPSFTIGDVSRKRQEIIQRLTDEGVFHLNKEIEFPVVPQRIAVISSETAAGYGDFTNQLAQNPKGYAFELSLFQSYMQGNEAEQSIIDALDKIFERSDNFDVVVIIRGGGAQADLNCFNSYWLCYHVTQFPLPVVTGIGHERDETVIDLVAHTNLKTPTAVAEFLINKLTTFDEYVDDLKNRVADTALEQVQAWKEENTSFSRTITSLVKLRIQSENQRTANLETMSRKLLKGFLQKNNQRLTTVTNRIRTNIHHAFSHDRQKLEMMQKNSILVVRNSLKDERKHLEQLGVTNHLLNPVHVMKRGFSLSFHNGVLIKSASQIKPGEIIESKWNDGSATSTISEVHQQKI